MKMIQKIFDSQRKHFEEKGKLRMLNPLFEATETFFFFPGILIKNSPFVRDNLDMKRFMSFVILALIPPSIFGIYNTGWQSCKAAGMSLDFSNVFFQGALIVLPLVMVSYAVGFFWEILFASLRKHPISEGFLVTGLLFPLTLPPAVPLWQAAVGISFGVVIGKEVFGGTGRNIFNPALTGRAFLFFAYPTKMSGDSVWVAVGSFAKEAVDTVSSATPLAFSNLAAAGDNIESVLEKAGFTVTKLFLGGYPGSIGGTSALCCLVGAIILVLSGVASYRIIAGGIFGVYITGLVLNFLAGPQANPWMPLPPFYHLIMGGFAFGIVYMATDPVSAPGMDHVKWIYGFAIGALTVLIRVFNPAYPEGVMMAILFMNLFSPLLDHIEIKFKLKNRILNV
ncbi:MAG: NADH:ubiquinone reductase (Na(+)-transporting) subunit B [Deltaproteobacteria bacterium]|nr:NADH:ubiquinone reductase (Na(+)-transporting) subunit B [Deltaproteobacteria bacterium]